MNRRRSSTAPVHTETIVFKLTYIRSWDEEYNVKLTEKRINDLLQQSFKRRSLAEPYLKVKLTFYQDGLKLNKVAWWPLNGQYEILYEDIRDILFNSRKRQRFTLDYVNEKRMERRLIMFKAKSEGERKHIADLLRDRCMSSDMYAESNIYPVNYNSTEEWDKLNDDEEIDNRIKDHDDKEYSPSSPDKRPSEIDTAEKDDQRKRRLRRRVSSLDSVNTVESISSNKSIGTQNSRHSYSNGQPRRNSSIKSDATVGQRTSVDLGIVPHGDQSYLFKDRIPSDPRIIEDQNQKKKNSESMTKTQIYLSLSGLSVQESDSDKNAIHTQTNKRYAVNGNAAHIVICPCKCSTAMNMPSSLNGMSSVSFIPIMPLQNVFSILPSLVTNYYPRCLSTREIDANSTCCTCGKIKKNSLVLDQYCQSSINHSPSNCTSILPISHCRNEISTKEPKTMSMGCFCHHCSRSDVINSNSRQLDCSRISLPNRESSIFKEAHTEQTISPNWIPHSQSDSRVRLPKNMFQTNSPDHSTGYRSSIHLPISNATCLACGKAFDSNHRCNSSAFELEPQYISSKASSQLDHIQYPSSRFESITQGKQELRQNATNIRGEKMNEADEKRKFDSNEKATSSQLDDGEGVNVVLRNLPRSSFTERIGSASRDSKMNFNLHEMHNRGLSTLSSTGSRYIWYEEKKL